MSRFKSVANNYTSTKRIWDKVQESVSISAQNLSRDQIKLDVISKNGLLIICEAENSICKIYASSHRVIPMPSFLMI